MNVKLLLALVALMGPVRDVLGDLNTDVLKEAGRRGRSRITGGFGPSRKVLPGLGQVEAKVKDIISHTGKLVDVMTGNSQRQDFFLDLCRKVQESQEVVLKTLQKLNAIASSAQSNTQQIRANQDVMVANQEKIQDEISNQHKGTRQRVAQAEKSLQNGLGALIATQADIVKSLQQSEDALAAGFRKLEEAERRTQALNNQVLQAVVDSAAANAEGQDNITAALGAFGQEALDGLDKALGRQKVILERIASIESSQLAKLKEVQSNQVNILRLIQESQRSVQQSIQEAIAIERATQSLVAQSLNVIQGELGEHKKDQAETQHLAKKCLANTQCDLDKVNHGLVEIAQLNAAVANGIRNGLKEVRNRQSATQNRVKSAEQTIISAMGAGFNEINGGVVALRERLESSRSQVQALFNSIGKNIRDTRNSQGNAQKLIDIIHGVIDKLRKH
uniref:PECP-1 n=1 Tax=Volegalea cochlidium TaxID=2555876 RepID=U5Y3P1_9CAEN